MHALVLIGAAALLLRVPPVPLRAQEPPKAEVPHHEFFSGVVTEVHSDRFTVRRQARKKEAQNQTFALTHETDVEGKLEAGARVTVGFHRTEGGEAVAVRVIVRARGGS
ncbi:MAG TPA: hypothetical protein DEH78_12145 [Solibacterales bacterium]|nr:hypothetical protein [Bryobacterales bacterium]